MRRPLVFPFIGLAPLGHLISQGGDFARDFIKRAGPAIDRAKVTLEFNRQCRHQYLGRVRSRFVQNMVGRVQNSAEQIQFLAEDLKRKTMRFVVARYKVDHRDIPLLTVPVTAADALFDALGIPRQVIVNDRFAKLPDSAPSRPPRCI